jgi:hypothetical protein
MDGRAAIHVASQPLLPVSTDFRTLDTLVDRLRRVAAKYWPKLTQSVAGQVVSTNLKQRRMYNLTMSYGSSLIDSINLTNGSIPY